jgi:hypothetical protein
MGMPQHGGAAPERTQFDYLLNALESAAQADKPAEHGYAEERRALFAYVRDLERRAAETTELRAKAAALREAVVALDNLLPR